jgi:hypothetical protein
MFAATVDQDVDVGDRFALVGCPIRKAGAPPRESPPPPRPSPALAWPHQTDFAQRKEIVAAVVKAPGKSGPRIKVVKPAARPAAL